MADEIPALEIYARPKGGFKVRIGERWESGLVADEALFVAANYCINPLAVPKYLRTQKEHRLMAAKYKKGGRFTDKQIKQMIVP